MRGLSAWIVLILGFAFAVPVKFSYTPPAGVEVKSVSLRGAFNNWGETPMKLEGKTWSVSVDLQPGRYAYKFFINGQWPRDMCEDATFGTKTDKGLYIDPQAEGCVDDGNGGRNAVRVVSAQAAAPAQPNPQAQAAPPLKEGYARVHYHRPDGNYEGWGLHLWEDTLEAVEWTKPFPQTGIDEFGAYWDFRLKEGAKKVGFIVHKGDEKDPGPDMFLLIETMGREVWVISGSAQIYSQKPDVTALPKGDLAKAQAHWLARDLIAWNVEVPAGGSVRFFYSPFGRMKLGRDGLSGGFALELQPAELPQSLKARFPHLAAYKAFRLPQDELEKVPGFLKTQTAVAAFDKDGKLTDATSLQIPGVLDELFFYNGPLGVSWEGGRPTLRVWAPTARSVRLHLFERGSGGEPRVLEMAEEKGVWSIRGDASWKNRFYLYEVDVWVNSTGKFEKNLVTDPYSLALSTNSRRSQIADLADANLKPQGWDSLKKPPLEAFEDVVVYELHVRDFSVFDNTVPENLRGTFRAFTVPTSNGMKHLKALADAGLTHLHLLPVMDIATIDEDKSKWKNPGDLSRFPRDSAEQQKAIGAIRDEDGYNWGYDPWHFNTPEGSYTTDPDGAGRTLEFRQMVAALNGIGLRVVVDVVYNHTNASGQAEKSVLDRIVPGYYHRLNKDGLVETSTCCQNTATEHRMMEKLMVDSVVLWAKAYKVDGFRFDLMGHHMKANMEAVRKALDELTLEKDGVDGKKIVIYGEGWNFGEVANNARGVNATQANLAGTGIATYSDRLRDAARGGGPFGDPREQGFISGLFTAPSAFTQLAPQAQRQKLLAQTQWIRSGLAGCLKDYRIGPNLTGGQVDYNGQPAGYTADPQECMNYVSKHDNETLFDAVMYKAPANASLADRIRMHNLGSAIVMFSQGIPFFQAGDDLLRSKSGDRNSYNSGDWFNRIDWSYQTHNWGIGLPMEGDNRERYPYLGPLLANPAFVVKAQDIQNAAAYFQELLRIRKSSPLFRLRTARDVQERLSFPEGPNQTPGLIVMLLGSGSPALDPVNKRVLVVFNAAPGEAQVNDPALRGAWRLHPVQQNSVDPVTKASSYRDGVFRVPGRTAAVFIEPGP
ncbi:pullulanase-type alpha-1,6-glucosidase [Calidithermus chliarophilus]|uniref:pullulanase-type alpha-1,6-glucosidase n=1 Tax=Calidithermus chliarophilus TaxID=52023 RepID=UPI000405B66F|nr:pullulanase-type alpha-1,6-glucosidase [Calidithermus chliarophilus]